MKSRRVRAFLASRRCMAWFIGILAAIELSCFGAAFYRHVRSAPSSAQIAAIALGMTQQQVRQILGRSVNGSPGAQPLHTATFNGYPLEVGTSVTWAYPTPFDLTSIDSLIFDEQFCVCFSARGIVSSIYYDD